MEAKGSGKERPKNPKEGSGLLSSILFIWVLPVLKNSSRFFKNLEGIYDPLQEDNSQYLGDQMEKAWNEEIELSKLRNKTPSLLKILFRIHKTQLILSAVLIFLVEFFFRLLTPLCLIEFIGHFDQNQRDVLSKEWFYASTAGLVISPFISVILNHFYHFVVFHIGMKLRVGISCLIYRKVLSLNRCTLGEISTGHLINLLSNDAGRFDFVGSFFFDIWIGPIQIFIIAAGLWMLIGPYCLVGISIIVFSIPVTVWLGKIISIKRLKTALRTDERVRIMNEIIIGIQVIKMYVWEKPFEKLVENIRRKEVDVIKRVSYIRGILYSLPMFHTRIAIFLTLITYALTGNDITASKVFVLTSLINVLQLTVADYFPQGASQISEFLISLKRIEEFLLLNSGKLKSLEDQSFQLASLCKASQLNSNEISIYLKNVCVKWSDESKYTLENVSLKIAPQQLTAIIGSVGSGKSSFFHTILRELEIKSGEVIVNGRISYSSQEPWLFPASIKCNILFGEEYNEEKFINVIKVCALEKDIDGFINRENTLIGERGVTLSGGQKARISLARAVYKDADIYLLDDPLSAVDTNVQKYIFNMCFQDFLKNKTVLLITHQLQYLQYVGQIVAIENGKITSVGDYDSLKESGFDFSIYLKKDIDSQEPKPKIKGIKPSEENNEENVDLINCQDEDINNAEEMKKKQLNLNVVLNYFKAGGNLFILLLIIIVFISAQVFASAGDYWTSYWVNLENTVFDNNETAVTDYIPDMLTLYPSQMLCIYVFTFLILSNTTLTLLRSSLFYIICMTASQKLHDKMFRAISRSPMPFFNENPSGRILNRFSKDIGNTDEILPSSMLSCLQIFISALGVFAVVPSTNQWLLIPSFAVIIIFFFMRKIYLNASYIIKRMEGTARSPIYTHLSLSLQGLSTIHALQANGLLKRTFDHHQDRHTATWYTFIAAGRAISLWLDIVCAIYNALVTMSFIFLKSSSFGGNVGLAITQTTALTSNLQWGMRQSAEVENQMTSVERILEYTNLQEENNFESPTGKNPHTWPMLGKIVLKNVYLRYNSNSPWVLNNLSFTILPSQKVGVVGRTGAGKSSLIAAIFLLFEVKGTIEIDEVDVTSIGLWDLRSKISVIPQDPVLFTGTLRYNLDPFNEFSDEVLWQALEEVELIRYVRTLQNGLLADIHEGGSNLSVGQRQLISLARAIVRNNKILVLDEPTANVDSRTDQFIQETIRRKFKNCTVITIAHRMNSIMDSDVILVMDFGKLVEFAHPYILLQNKSGYFYELVQQTGCFEELHSVAARHFSSRDIEEF